MDTTFLFLFCIPVDDDAVEVEDSAISN